MCYGGIWNTWKEWNEERRKIKMEKGKILINVNDIIGKRLGKLKVIRYYGHRYSITRGGDRLRHYYYCQCECGNICIAQRAQLLNEIVHSCGCGKGKRNGHKDEG